MRKNMLFLFACVIVVSAVLLRIHNVCAQEEETKLMVRPQYLEVEVRKTFNIDVYLENVTNLFGFEFKLRYNTTFLDLIHVDVRPFLNEPTFTAKNEIDEEIGQYWLAITSLAPAEPKNGSGVLVSLTFNVTKMGGSYLKLEDTKLGNPDALPINHTTVDGYVSCYETKIHTVTVDTLPFNITTQCNATTSAIVVDAEHIKLSLNVSGTQNTSGFINITIPKEFMWGPFKVLVNETEISPLITENGNTSIYFTFKFSESSLLCIEVIGTGIIPEFSNNLTLTAAVLLISMAIVMLTKSIGKPKTTFQ